MDGTGRAGEARRAILTGLAAALALAAAPLLIAGWAPFGTGAAPSPHGAPGQQSLCVDCHDPHLAGFDPLLRYPAGDELCWACHREGLARLPAPRAEYEASPHFRGLGGQPREAAGPAASTCLACHQPHGRVAGVKLLRGTAGTGPGAVSASCGACHPDRVPTGASGRSFVSLDVYRQTRHADPQRGARLPGSPGGAGECTACHTPHASAYPSLLRADGEASCYPCHPKPAGANNLWTGEKVFQRSAHAAVCLGCHNPHGAADPATGSVFPKALGAREYDLCVGCHRDVGERFAESLRATAAFGVRSRHPVDQPGAAVRCVSCHNPHQIRANPDGYQPALTDPDSGKLFLWLSGTTSPEFCLRCHDGSWPKAANIASELASRKAAVSGFVWRGKGINLHYVHLKKYHKQKCSSCHDPHATPGVAGVNRGRLLTGLVITAYEQGYPGFDSCETNCHHARCASCHPAPPDWARPD